MRWGRLSQWFPIALLAVVATLTFWLDRQAQPPESGRDGKLRHDPDYIVDGLSATRFGSDGAPSHTLKSTHMVHYPDDDSTHLDEPRFVHFSRGKAPVYAQSLSATVSSNGDDVYMQDEVELRRDAYAEKSAMRLETSYLHLIPDSNLAETSRPVKIYNGNTLVTAVGLKFDNETQVLNLISDVQTTYLPKTPAPR
jgi:lipopolysaccharide export system protein LptC